MTKVSALNVRLHGQEIATLTRVGSDQTIFTFTQDYIDQHDRPTLGLHFKDAFGGLRTEIQPTRIQLSPFFSNLLPEGHLRTYLAKRAGVNPVREFFLIWVLGEDMPGAITVEPVEGQAWPRDEAAGSSEVDPTEAGASALRFSLAGVQLKFSAIEEARGGLTIPASGVGGSRIVKLPSRAFEGVPENEFSMMSLAALVGIEVPKIALVDIAEIGNLPAELAQSGGRALSIERFDRLTDGAPVHMEDFAQVFGVYPADKYKKASYRNIAAVIAAEVGEQGIIEFIRRLTFNVLIGNADMHLKNWSLIYPDRRHAALAPAYDFVSTIAYLPDDTAALSFSRTKRFDEFTEDELAHLSAKAMLPEKVVLDTALETVALFQQHWAAEKKNLFLTAETIEAIDRHLLTVPLAR